MPDREKVADTDQGDEEAVIPPSPPQDVEDAERADQERADTHVAGDHDDVTEHALRRRRGLPGAGRAAAAAEVGGREQLVQARQRRRRPEVHGRVLPGAHEDEHADGQHRDNGRGRGPDRGAERGSARTEDEERHQADRHHEGQLPPGAEAQPQQDPGRDQQAGARPFLPAHDEKCAEGDEQRGERVVLGEARVEPEGGGRGERERPDGRARRDSPSFPVRAGT